MSNEELFILAKQGDEEAKNELFTTNMRSVGFVVKRFKDAALDYDDMTSLAHVGMMKAYNSFDPAKGIKFVTYASRCMYNEILMGLRTTRKLSNKLSVSLETCVMVGKDGIDATFNDILSDDTDVAQYVENREMCRSAMKMVDLLKPVHRKVFLEYVVNERSQQEISEMIGTSRSHISRIAGRIEYMFYRFRETGKFSVKVREDELLEHHRKYPKQKVRCDKHEVELRQVD